MENSKERAEFELKKTRCADLLRQISDEVERIGVQIPGDAVMSLHRLELAASEFAQTCDTLLDYQYKRQLEQIKFEQLLHVWHRCRFPHDKHINTLVSCVKLVGRYNFDPERYVTVQRKIEAYKAVWDGIKGEVSARDIDTLSRTSINVMDELLGLIGVIESRATRLELVIELAGFFTE